MSIADDTLNAVYCIRTVYGDVAFVFNFAIIVFNDALVFAIHIGGNIGENEFIGLAVIGLLKLFALLRYFHSIQIPLDRGAVSI